MRPEQRKLNEPQANRIDATNVGSQKRNLAEPLLYGTFFVLPLSLGLLVVRRTKIIFGKGSTYE